MIRVVDDFIYEGGYRRTEKMPLTRSKAPQYLRRQRLAPDALNVRPPCQAKIKWCLIRLIQRLT